MSSSYQPRIAIVGAGPSGLTMGILLLKRNIHFTIFDLRTKPTDNDLTKPAGMLDLHEESGLAALTECDLMDDFNAHTGVCTEHQIVVSKEGHLIYQDEGTAEFRPEISRNSLTKILLDRVPIEMIKWEHKLISTNRRSTSSGNTEIELDFGANGKRNFDLVIGADGTWSRTRNLLTNIKPMYSGLQLITVTIRQVTERYPDIANYVGLGSFTALANGHGIMSQRALQDSARIYVFLSTPDEKFSATSGLATDTIADFKHKLLNDNALLGQFGQQLKNLVEVACTMEANDNAGTKIPVTPLYELPEGHSWNHSPGVTLIGDASHVMNPFAGEGVNLAMWDALELSRAIIEAHNIVLRDAASFQSALDPLIEEFEASMAERAKVKAEETNRNRQMMFGSNDGSSAFVKFMVDAVGAVMEEQDKSKIYPE